MQTILGSGGSIGTDLAKTLTQYTDEIRLVSRNPVKVNDTDILHPVDLSDAIQINKAIEGSEICYVTLGFDYSLKAWKEKWHSFMANVIDACLQHQTKLVFFDNVYSIGKDNVHHITENSPISPSSKKGEIRAAVDKLILEEVNKGNLKAIIARAPDFFGPIKNRTA
jgi:nucleoside-diphosphate-sugar epimerase